MKIKKTVKEAMELLQIKKLRRNQIKPINSILDKHDTMVIAPTSYGKSLIYQIPAIIQKKKLTVVIEPLLALIHDQVEKLQRLGISAAYLDSTQTDKEQNTVMENLRKGNVQILYMAPERLETNILSQIEKKNQIGMVVVDECHCVATWGNTFRDAYLTIGEHIEGLKKRPVVVALSASILSEDRPQIFKQLSMKKVKTFETSLYRSKLQFMKRTVSSRKEQLHELKRSLKKYHKNRTIIFCATKHIAECVGEMLEKVYPEDVLVYHSRKKTQERELLSGEKSIIVATSALSMGVDVKDVDLVIHYNMPLSLADYYQMAGRAGREGQKARSILLYNPDDYGLSCALLGNIDDKNVKKAMMKRLDAMKEFCEETKECMVKTLLQALGDTYNRKRRYCTNCQRRDKNV